MDNKIPTALLPKFQEDVLSIIAGRKPSPKIGSLADEENVSFVTSELRYKGWRNLRDIEDMLEEAGFKIREIHIGNGTRRAFVGL